MSGLRGDRYCTSNALRLLILAGFEVVLCKLFPRDGTDALSSVSLKELPG